MGSKNSRSVEIQVQNKTQSITLRNPRTHFECGSCSKPPCAVEPCSTELSTFKSGSSASGVAGILVFEADSFTLAVFFSNRLDKDEPRLELGLELTQGRAHDDLESTYNRMAQGSYSSSCLDVQFHRAVMGRSHGAARLSHDPLRVTATMSNARRAVLKVVLEEEAGSREALAVPHGWMTSAGIRNICSMVRAMLEEERRLLEEGRRRPRAALPGEATTHRIVGRVLQEALERWETPGDTPKTGEICRGPRRHF